MIKYKRVVKLIIVEEVLVGVIWEKYDKNCSKLFYIKKYNLGVYDINELQTLFTL